MINYIKSNVVTFLLVIFLALVVLNPRVKGFILRQAIKTGLYDPDIGPDMPSAVSVSGKPAGSLAPRAIFRAAGGEIVDISNSKGKVIFINFWATWCPPCIAEMPSINSLQAKFRGNTDILFVMADIDKNLKLSEDFMKRNDYDLAVYEPAAPIPGSIYRGIFPTTVIIDKQGKIVFFHEGMANYDSERMEKFVRGLAE
jgi:thiol-disulfide isomerase/thioredoxin